MGRKGEGSLPLHWKIQRNCSSKVELSVHSSPLHPIVFHNLSGYDAHLFIRELEKKFDSGSISVIAENKEKYISFYVKVFFNEYKTPLGETKQIKRELRFIDSIRFMFSSLDSLGNWLE